MSEAILVNYHEDEVIVRQGDPTKCLYKVMSGTVALYLNYGENDEYLVGLQSFPNCFGEMTILAGQPSLYTVVALNDAVVLHVPEDAFDAFIKNDPQNAIVIMKTMARNFSMVNMNMNLLVDELREISKHSADEGDTFRRLADQYGNINLDSIPAPETSDDAASAISDDSNGLYLPGHKGYHGITHPEYNDRVYTREYVCPHCKKKFFGNRIFQSKLLPIPRALWETRYDLRQFYQAFDPIWYEMETCPHCAFSSFADYFLEMKILSVSKYEQQLKNAAEILLPHLNTEHDLEHVFAQHYLALICAQGYATRQQLTAQIWTNLCWLYEDTGDKELESLAAAHAAQAWMDVDNHCMLTPSQEQRVYLMIAAMLWKNGKGSEAREWAVKSRSNHCEKLYSDIAGQLIDEIRESVEQN